jgi:hypothetical protein
VPTTQPSGPAQSQAAQAPDDDPENPANWIGLNYVHERLDAQLSTQARLWDEADGRLRTILGIIGVVFAATLGLLPRGASLSSAGTVDQASVSYLVGAPAQLAILLYFAAGLCALIGYWPRSFNWPPAPESLRKYVTTDERIIKLYVFDRMLLAFDQNAKRIGLKFRLFQVAVVISTMATGLLGVAVFFALVHVTRPLGS